MDLPTDLNTKQGLLDSGSGAVARLKVYTWPLMACLIVPSPSIDAKIVDAATSGRHSSAVVL